MSTEVISSARPGAGAAAFRWLLPALAVVAIMSGLWAWSLDGRAQPAGLAVHPILLTESMDAVRSGSDMRAESAIFVTQARTWTAYWSYYCLVPGEISRWHARLWLVRVVAGREQTPRLLYGAGSGHGPVSYTQILREPGPGAFRFIVTITAHCVWSLRAPPVTDRTVASLGTTEGEIE
jgi:hypothetical protein